MKIISGYLKGRNILGYDIVGTRPTMSRVKESLFAMIQDQVRDSVCLDLFAGSGNLGIEALSNQARMCYFSDKNSKCIDVIMKNIELLKLQEKAIILKGDYLSNLDKIKDIKFDLIFLDPPYDMKINDELLKIINKRALLKKDGQVIVEYEKDKLEEKYGNLLLIKERYYSDKNVRIYQNMID